MRKRVVRTNGYRVVVETRFGLREHDVAAGSPLEAVRVTAETLRRDERIIAVRRSALPGHHTGFMWAQRRVGRRQPG